MIIFEITIKEITKEVVKRTKWEKISDTGGEDGGAKYGSVKSDIEEDVSREVYSQKVDSLDMEDVIKAINKIK